MGVIRIDNKLHKRLQDWLDRNGNKYKYPSIAAFINNVVYEKLTELEQNENKK